MTGPDATPQITDVTLLRTTTVQALSGVVALATGIARAAPAPPTTVRPQLLVITEAAPRQAVLLGRVREQLTRTSRFGVKPLAALRPLMRQRDRASGRPAKAAALVEEARRAMLALDHATALQRLDQALALMRESFVRFYDPSRLAQVHLLRGVAAFNATRPDHARREFRTAHHLDDSLTLDAHYRPQVRQAFEQALRNAPPRPEPPGEAVGAALELVEHGQLALVLLSATDSTGQIQLRALVYDPQRKGYARVESAIVPQDAKPAAAARFGKRLREQLEARFAPPATAPSSRPVAHRPDLVRAPEPASRPTTRASHPWYKRWYVWTLIGAAAAAAGAAVAVPLLTRTEVVDIPVTNVRP